MTRGAWLRATGENPVVRGCAARVAATGGGAPETTDPVRTTGNAIRTGDRDEQMTTKVMAWLRT